MAGLPIRLDLRHLIARPSAGGDGTRRPGVGKLGDYFLVVVSCVVVFEVCFVFFL